MASDLIARRSTVPKAVGLTSDDPLHKIIFELDVVEVRTAKALKM